eukprot:3747032-Pyramimonas_sp.AAC.1
MYMIYEAKTLKDFWIGLGFPVPAMIVTRARSQNGDARHVSPSPYSSVHRDSASSATLAKFVIQPSSSRIGSKEIYNIVSNFLRQP